MTTAVAAPADPFEELFEFIDRMTFLDLCEITKRAEDRWNLDTTGWCYPEPDLRPKPMA